jgi:hypothetical protein
MNDRDSIIAMAGFIVNEGKEKDKRKASLVDDTLLQKYYNNNCSEPDLIGG